MCLREDPKKIKEKTGSNLSKSNLRRKFAPWRIRPKFRKTNILFSWKKKLGVPHAFKNFPVRFYHHRNDLPPPMKDEEKIFMIIFHENFGKFFYPQNSAQKPVEEERKKKHFGFFDFWRKSAHFINNRCFWSKILYREDFDIKIF